MERTTLGDYLKRNNFSELVYEIKKPHKLLNYDRPIQVYFEDIRYKSNDRSRFLLFDDGEFSMNAISFDCNIEQEDIVQIAKDMVEELLLCSDFSELDRELEGKCACIEYEEIYKSCDECHLYNINDGHGCMGAMYTIPSHMNVWRKTESKWNDKYGEKSEQRKRWKLRIAKDAINSLKWTLTKGDKDIIKEIKDYFNEEMKRIK